jgi:hypothetical protein
MYGIFVILLFGLILGWISTHGVKSQQIRLVDVFIIGPLMVFVGLRLLPSSTLAALAVIFFGATTISFNLKNYIYQASTERAKIYSV